MWNIFFLCPQLICIRKQNTEETTHTKYLNVTANFSDLWNVDSGQGFFLEEKYPFLTQNFFVVAVIT